MSRLWIFLWFPWTVLFGRAAASTLTEAEFVAAAETSPAHAAVLEEETVVAEAQVRRTALWPNPSFVASRETPAGTAETTLALRWEVPAPGRALRQGMAFRRLEAATSRLESARFGLRLELRAAYARWAVAAERREVLQAQRARLTALANSARARADAGEMPGLAARRLELEAAQAAFGLAEAEAQLALARAGVAAWLPTLAPEARPMLPPLPSLPPKPPPAAHRPDLVALGHEVERAEAQLELSRKLWAAPELELGWKRLEERGRSAAGTLVGLSWTLPLFDRRRAEGVEAEARLRAARAELELAGARAAAEVEGAAAAFEARRARAHGFAQATAELTTLTAGAEAAYTAGEAGLTDLLDALRAAFGARLSALDAWNDALAASRALDLTLGPSPTTTFGGQP